MTDGRFPERWLNDRRFAKISDAAFRLFTIANTWSASNRTDGAITRDDLQLLPRHVPIDCTHELVDAGFWVGTDDGWQIAGWSLTQTTAAQLEAAEHARMLDRDRKARSRARNDVSPDPEPVRPDIPPDVQAEGTGQARARPGQAATGSSRGPDSRSENELEISAGAAKSDPWGETYYDWQAIGAEQPPWNDGDNEYPSYADEYAEAARAHMRRSS